MLPYYNVAILQCCHTTMLPYHNVAILQCCHTTMLPYCNVAILQCCHTTMLPYYNVAILQCCHTAMLPYYNVAILQCCHTTMLPYYNVAILQCCHTTMLLYHNVAILQCCHTTMLPYYNVAIPQCCHTTMLPYYNVAILQCCHTTIKHDWTSHSLIFFDFQISDLKLEINKKQLQINNPSTCRLNYRVMLIGSDFNKYSIYESEMFRRRKETDRSLTELSDLPEKRSAQKALVSQVVVRKGQHALDDLRRKKEHQLQKAWKHSLDTSELRQSTDNLVYPTSPSFIGNYNKINRHLMQPFMSTQSFVGSPWMELIFKSNEAMKKNRQLEMEKRVNNPTISAPNAFHNLISNNNNNNSNNSITKNNNKVFNSNVCINNNTINSNSKSNSFKSITIESNNNNHNKSINSTSGNNYKNVNTTSSENNKNNSSTKKDNNKSSTGSSSDNNSGKINNARVNSNNLGRSFNHTKLNAVLERNDCVKKFQAVSTTVKGENNSKAQEGMKDKGCGSGFVGLSFDDPVLNDFIDFNQRYHEWKKSSERMNERSVFSNEVNEKESVYGGIEQSVEGNDDNGDIKSDGGANNKKNRNENSNKISNTKSNSNFRNYNINKYHLNKNNNNKSNNNITFTDSGLNQTSNKTKSTFHTFFSRWSTKGQDECSIFDTPHCTTDEHLCTNHPVPSFINEFPLNLVIEPNSSATLSITHLSHNIKFENSLLVLYAVYKHKTPAKTSNMKKRTFSKKKISYKNNNNNNNIKNAKKNAYDKSGDNQQSQKLGKSMVFLLCPSVMSVCYQVWSNF